MKIINRDLLTIESGIIAHQVNCQGKMGAGLALKIRKKYPEVYEYYRHNIPKRGDVQIIQISPKLFVANLAAQQDYGRVKGKRYTNYGAFRNCLIKIRAISSDRNLIPYLPYKIGCGLAGGDWSMISGFIERHLPDAVICKLES
ncbi:MAG: hypothetical protein QNJ38_10825 [Prochloraceae cyanobacterium]|nr:hypothetical protein [Prochloraceae cyanobacterium]